MKTIKFVTGNHEKIRDATYALKHYGIKVEQVECELNEIQHHEPAQIGLAKAKAAYSLLKQPLVINDSSWQIPALGGFPGGYMKDVTAWLSTGDFLALMHSKQDKQIILNETVVYIDQTEVKLFEACRQGKFVSEPAGSSGPSFARVIKMENDDLTVSQIFDKKGERDLDRARYAHWNKFGTWYSQ